jgi:hypothetical protein
MEETLVRSQCGLYTVLAGQKTLHSRYNPVTEAERYLDSLKLDGGIRYIILAECCLCYLIEPLRGKFPSAKIISLHIRAFYGGKGPARPDAEWLPDSAVSCGEFLENEIGDAYAGMIKIIEWRPAADVYGEEYLNLVKDIAAFVKRSDANRRTQAVFGRRWFKNIIRNCLLFNNDINITLPVRNGAGCVAAGAGPGLETAYSAIRRLTQNGALLISVSSAAGALLNAGIFPDIIVACDGGNWALLHFFESVRHFSKKNMPYPILAFSLNAALPSQCAAFNLMPVSDGTLFQNLAQKCFGIPQISFPQRGTVGASAIDLAFYLSDGPVYSAGINFSHNDIRTHVKPYAFDKILSASENRLRPLYSLQFERSDTITRSGVNGIYSDWFSRKSYPRKILSIPQDGFIGGNMNGPQKINARKFNRVKKSGVNRPVTRFISTLIGALNTPETREKLTAELSNLLLKDGAPPPDGGLREELFRVSKKYRSAEAQNE